MTIISSTHTVSRAHTKLGYPCMFHDRALRVHIVYRLVSADGVTVRRRLGGGGGDGVLTHTDALSYDYVVCRCVRACICA